MILENHRRWKVYPEPPQHALNALGNLPPLLAHLLYNRGVRTPQEAHSFLSDSEGLLEDPFSLPDMHRAVHRLHQARLSNETVAVFGDFDVDGVTGTALLSQVLSRMGLSVIPYIPHRVDEGHGLNTRAVHHLREAGATLLVTVDCGITSVTEVQEATALGMDVVITDHHAPPPTPPPACAIVNPRLAASRYAFPHLAGVGLALKLAQALFQRQHPSDWHRGLLEMAALGTVTDVAPLLGENRYIVSQGLRQLNATENRGLQALYHEAGLKSGAIDTEAIGWAIGPRLNAAGRLEHAMTSYRLLTTDSEAEARQLAGLLEEQNQRRQRMTEETLQQAHRQLGPTEELGPLLMVGGEEFSPGIVGLVAGKLAEEFYRPAVALAIGKTHTMGSCRSIPEFNMAEALTVCGDLFIRYGGHPRAAGFTIANDRLDELRQRLTSVAAERLEDMPLQPTLNIEAQVRLSELGGETFRQLQSLAPFGAENPTPVFLSRGVEVVSARSMGSADQHIRMKLREGSVMWDAVAFRQALVPGMAMVDIVYTMGVSAWGGEPMLQLTVLDFRPAGDGRLPGNPSPEEFPGSSKTPRLLC